MNKVLLYIILGIVLLAGVIVLSEGFRKKPRRLDERISLRRTDKIPYGSFVAYEALHSFFPAAEVETNYRGPMDWPGMNSDEERELLVIISPQFLPDDDEMERLKDFVASGNDIFISTRVMSYAAQNALSCKMGFYAYEYQPVPATDTLRVGLEEPPFTRAENFEYPGKRFETYFAGYDSLRTHVLGRGRNGAPNFIHMKRGSGNLYLHLAPLAFSNYFLLHGDNRHYFENVFSVIDPPVRKIAWDEYFLHKLRETRDEGSGASLLHVLFRYPSLKWGLLTAMLFLLLFALLEMRRRQQVIPFYAPPANESLDFARTVGRLYYQRKDHKNLAKKMASFFQEHIRTRYRIPAGMETGAVIELLHFKSGYPEDQIRGIFASISSLDKQDQINEEQLAGFHRQLELFYQNT